MQNTNLNSLRSPLVPDGYTIRTYQRGDETSWKKIIASSFGSIGTDQSIERIINTENFDPKSLFFITNDNLPIGTAWASLRPEGEQNTGYVEMVGVAPDHQGKRLGALLVLCTLHYIREKGLSKAALFASADNLPAIKTYLRTGFRPIYLKRHDEQLWNKVFTNLKVQENHDQNCLSPM